MGAVQVPDYTQRRGATMPVKISDALEIPDRELAYEFSRSPGPGGQNVNKVSTQVTVCFNVGDSAVLDAAQKSLLGRRLGHRITKEGVLRVTARRHRTQSANRRAAEERLAELISTALRPKRLRIATQVPRRARRVRVEDKRRRSQVKQRRRRPPSEG